MNPIFGMIPSINALCFPWLLPGGLGFYIDCNGNAWTYIWHDFPHNYDVWPPIPMVGGFWFTFEQIGTLSTVHSTSPLDFEIDFTTPNENNISVIGTPLFTGGCTFTMRFTES